MRVLNKKPTKRYGVDHVTALNLVTTRVISAYTFRKNAYFGEQTHYRKVKQTFNLCQGDELIYVKRDGENMLFFRNSYNAVLFRYEFSQEELLRCFKGETVLPTHVALEIHYTEFRLLQRHLLSTPLLPSVLLLNDLSFVDEELKWAFKHLTAPSCLPR